MLPDRSELPINLELQPSFILAAVFLSLHVIAFACICSTILPLAGKLLLGVVLSGSALFTVKRHGSLNTKKSVRHIQWLPAQGWLLEYQSGEIVEVDLLPSTYVHPLLVILNFVSLENNRRQSVPLLQEMVGKQTFRQLRVFLRWNLKNSAE